MKTLPSPQSIYTPIPETPLTISDMGALVVRRRAIIAGVTFAFLAIASLYCLLSTRRYMATGTIQIQKDSSDALRLESMMQGGAADEDALDENITLQTQTNILQSDSLALRVIEDLHLDKTPDFESKFNPIDMVLGIFSPGGASDPPGASLQQSPGRMSHALKVFSKNLTVTPVVGTRLIQISYVSSDRKLAESVVNALAQDLTNFSFETRYKATAQTSQWLTSQMADLRKQSEALQAKVADLQKEAGVYTVGDGGPDGKTQAYSSDINRLELATTALSGAESNRILTGAVEQIVKTGDPELISGLAGSPMLGAASSGVASSLSLIQGLRSQEAVLQGQMAEYSSKFSPDYPKLVDMKSNLQVIQAAIASEVARMGARAENDFKVAKTAEAQSQMSYKALKKRADALNDKTIEYELTRQEATDSRTLYVSLLGRLKEAGLLEGLRSTNVSVVDPGRSPAKPTKPNIPLFLGGGLASGLFLGFCAALLFDTTDTKIQDLDELELMLGGVPIGILPAFDRPATFLRLTSSSGLDRIDAVDPVTRNVIALQQPNSGYVEALRAIRTSLYLSKGGSPPQVVLITSSIEGEGKSTLAANFAVLLARQGKKVLLVDGDLRRPKLHTTFDVAMEGGLSSILSGSSSEKDSSQYSAPVTSLPNLKLLVAGAPPTEPTDLLSSTRMLEALAAWRREYSFVIIDAAPVLSATDSVILSGLVDTTLLLGRYKYTDRQLLARSYRLLQMHGGSPTGIVLNGIEREAEKRYSCYGYSGSDLVTQRKGGEHANA
ncbi:Tyrosine-protein kinase EpsD [Acidisarcina polymorpha]|uniref:non-specific protein-tyrosine kinase n=1 Tax=Acidisarcina polymorpha TaxID=2211140 RepID=A0A2Z5G3A3_9BACT|nr:polysaccharide biosynthesis tyrosine autokinase [Acidisarcina polymorpha]AXC13683.1 Tyrosine-protein kinase EpsD [Acidisarcina polymorpha]